MRVLKVVSFVVAFAGSLMLFASVCSPCSVPVFRYALERWAPDAYTAVIYHRSKLSGEDVKAVEILEECEVGVGAANLKLEFVDLDGKVDETKRKLWDAQGRKALPFVVLMYPRGSRDGLVAWSGPLNLKTAREIVSSPVRREIAQSLVRGDTAVFLLLESGKKETDDEKARLLTRTFERMAKELKLPTLDEGVEGEPALKPDAALAITFSVVRLSRTDPREQVLVRTLMDSEDGLEAYDGPMVFPVFGRGRALYALVDKGVNEENIEEAGMFLTGPCMCQIKAENPGVDLLLDVDWNGLITGELIIDEAFPELTGASAPVVDANATQSGAGAAGAEDSAEAASAGGSADRPPAGGKLEFAVGFVLVLALLVVLLGSLILKGRGK